ncbi:(2Fe-2S)-binding protein [Roseofilum capinflatum]|uniref:Bacterioferritin-associated ferredoxin n=1 Tax=Roseofilum capinflatum BLCC-M114 TaxID=3022440 RepID=A0ABT7BCH0_9CYAN|nr:(2Fe-2S)-binding protein [Roseofilum capinflatum]MDJ1176211.1 (2Fe-2S)-binding protein [Roseofilum capinflatum BLCC-M114]
MYICICHAVTDREIRKAVAQGACSVDMVCDRLKVSSSCGRCREHAHQLVEEAIAEHQAPVEITSIARQPQEVYGDRRKAS